MNHKILDLAGDFVLSGYRIIGKVTCFQGGHQLSNMFLRSLMKSHSAYDVVELNEEILIKKVNQNDNLKIAVNA